MYRTQAPLMQRVLALTLIVATTAAYAETRFDQSTTLGLETRLFAEPASQPGARGQLFAGLTLDSSLHWIWNDGRDLVDLRPYLRLDARDSDRNHVDLRELAWTHANEDYELRAGIRRVFWGVTEFQHLVDIINQTDGLDDIDGEDKLGQPMVNLSFSRDWGILDLYLLTGFRERKFPGRDSRLRAEIPIDTSSPYWESDRQERHIDLAARWSQYIDIWDIGLSVFKGTERDPQLLVDFDADGELLLVPYYRQITQYGLDLQATLDDWLWKLELIHRRPRSDEAWTAAQMGFEYTLVGIADSAADLGLLVEYGWDERGNEPPGVLNQSDLFLGTRLTLNDVDGSELLAGIGVDLDGQGESLVVEASRRIGNDWKLSADLRVFHSPSLQNPLFDLRDDSHLQITLQRFF